MNNSTHSFQALKRDAQVVVDLAAALVDRQRLAVGDRHPNVIGDEGEDLVFTPLTHEGKRPPTLVAGDTALSNWTGSIAPSPPREGEAAMIETLVYALALIGLVRVGGALALGRFQAFPVTPAPVPCMTPVRPRSWPSALSGPTLVLLSACAACTACTLAWFCFIS